MRRSGKTTRLVDYAIQQLFEKGSLFVPDGKYLSDMDASKGFPSEQRALNRALIDNIEFGHTSGENQRHFLKRIVRRLDLEHAGQFEVKGNSITIINRS